MKSKHFFKLMVVIFISCGIASCQPAVPAQLQLQLYFQQQPLDCQRSFLLAGQQWQLAQLQLYLADFQLNGQPALLHTDEQMPWQQQRLALLGTDCQTNGQWQLQFAGPLPKGELTFVLGVPDDLNHQNPLTAPPPLSQSDMFWSWQGGHKFFRLELKSAADGWALHLGSTGCQSASVLRPPAGPCTQPNRARFSLPYQGEKVLALDLALLLTDFTPTARHNCMSDTLQQSCQLLLPKLLKENKGLWHLKP